MSWALIQAMFWLSLNKYSEQRIILLLLKKYMILPF
jgi:hypothetical protein